MSFRTSVCSGTRALILALICLSFWAAGSWGADRDGKVGRTGPASEVSSGAGKEEVTPTPRASARPKKATEPWDPARAAEEFRRLQFELALAKAGEVYMVIDAERGEILLKLKGTVVWNSHMEIAPEDSDAVGAFAQRFTGEDRQLIRMLTSKHLFAAKEKTPDSILAIVGQVVKADPQLLQRDIPQRFELKWGWDVILDVRTDIVGEPRSKMKNLEVSVIEALQRPLGGTRLKVRLASDDALTLYRAASLGLPTLLYPSH
jgi:hypothetical protein